MESKAILRYARISPPKVRLVINLVRGKDVKNALSILQYTHKKASGLLFKLLNSAFANAKQKAPSLQPEDMYVEEIYADCGPVAKRVMPRAMGRANRIIKRTSHITIKLNSYEE